MKIYMMVKDEVEAQGIQWIVSAHLPGVELAILHEVTHFIEALRYQQADLFILDMDSWPWQDEQLSDALRHPYVRWIGISSERIFQTAYRGLQFRARDILFRPFSSEDFIASVRRVRTYMTREFTQITQYDEGDHELAIDYSDFLLAQKQQHPPLLLSVFSVHDLALIPTLYRELASYPFMARHGVFVLSKFVLVISEQAQEANFTEAYYNFLNQWKEKYSTPVAVINHSASEDTSLQEAYQQARALFKHIFFEGFDIIINHRELLPWQNIDPFLTPVEQRQWIEMLEKKDMRAIRAWIETEFLLYEQPYPDPDIIRIRLTSLLAQIRRYMKSYHVQSKEWEQRYHLIFQCILQSPVIHQIAQQLLQFISNLLEEVAHYTDVTRNFVNQVMSLMELNYWDAQWGLTECAAALHLNKSTLSRKFSKEASLTFGEALHQVKIKEAETLLRNSELTIEEVAKLVGYTHQSYFNTKFKELTQKTPKQYRTGL